MSLKVLPVAVAEPNRFYTIAVFLLGLNASVIALWFLWPIFSPPSIGLKTQFIPKPPPQMEITGPPIYKSDDDSRSSQQEEIIEEPVIKINGVSTNGAPSNPKCDPKDILRKIRNIGYNYYQEIKVYYRGKLLPSYDKKYKVVEDISRTELIEPALNDIICPSQPDLLTGDKQVSPDKKILRGMKNRLSAWRDKLRARGLEVGEPKYEIDTFVDAKIKTEVKRHSKSGKTTPITITISIGKIMAGAYGLFMISKLEKATNICETINSQISKTGKLDPSLISAANACVPVSACNCIQAK